jgi:hypothetical protein
MQTYFFAYDPNNLTRRLRVALIRLESFFSRFFLRKSDMPPVDLKTLSIQQLSELFPKLGLENHLADYILVIDFNLDQDFEALDESFILGLSDKRVYLGEEALGIFRKL